MPWNVPPCAWHSAGLTGPMHDPLGKQHAPRGKHTYVPHAVPAPPGVPPAAAQFAGVRFRHPPVEGKQHACTGCGQLSPRWARWRMRPMKTGRSSSFTRFS